MRKPFTIVVSLVAILILGGLSIAAAQKKIDPPYHDLNLAAPAGSVSGADLYKQLCAGCHGVDAHGVGPTSPYCSVPPTDLTLLKQEKPWNIPREQSYADFAVRYGKAQPEHDVHASMEAAAFHDPWRVGGIDREENNESDGLPEEYPTENSVSKVK